MRKISNPRQLAVVTLTKLTESEDFLREVLASQIEQNALAGPDQNLFTELVYGTVRMRKNLDYVLAHYSKRPLEKIQAIILNNLRVGAYQILYLDRVPDSAAVNEAVKLAHLFSHRGTAGFTNAILRQVSRGKEELTYPSATKKPLEYLAVKYSFPRWILKQWLMEWGFKETEQLCQALNKPPELHVRVNTLKSSVEDLRRYFLQKNYQVHPSRFAPDVLGVQPAARVIRDPALAEGCYYIQDESSALVAHALKVEPGQSVYDLCSAPGGKTTHIAQLMENKGEMLAIDISAKRLQVVEENAARLGISIIKTLAEDAAKSLSLPPVARVLVDAPCSGLGTMRHRPDIRWRKTWGEVKELVRLQKTILTQAAKYVAKGGLLVYSTCTLLEEENQAVAKWFLNSQPSFTTEPLPPWFPQAATEANWYRTFLPHRHGLDGFFVAVFRKL